MRGKYVIVTGATSGMGLEIAKALYSAGATLILAVRNVDAGQRVANEMMPVAPDQPRPYVLHLDLASIKSIEAFADEFLRMNVPLHVLINNAGVFATPYKQTVDGLEYQLAVNCIGPFYLMLLLREKLLASAPARVVNVNSSTHKLSNIKLKAPDAPNYEKLNSKKGYNRFSAYFNSKLLNLALSKELHRQLASRVVFHFSLIKKFHLFNP